MARSSHENMTGQFSKVPVVLGKRAEIARCSHNLV